MECCFLNAPAKQFMSSTPCTGPGPTAKKMVVALADGVLP